MAHSPPPPDDLGARLLAAGSTDAFLASVVCDSASLRRARALAAQCHAQRAAATAPRSARKADAALRDAAAHSLHDARARLEEIRARATAALFEHEERRRDLRAVLDAFRELADARADANAVAACRGIADAYVAALHPLAVHQRDGSRAEMESVAENIAALIAMVDGVRRKGSKFLFGDDKATNQRIILSIENRAVDAVIKARAVFVNVLDNEFRNFGWPMNVPVPGRDDPVIDAVNFYSKQLGQLQRVASKGDYVPERTRWHRALSDSWAVAAILRAPLARFKYHFLESFRVDASAGSPRGMHQPAAPSHTSRFDRPEWAAEFALDRIREATPFLSKVAIDGSKTADVKFAEGFCRVFAEKIAYDCELALRTSTNDADADVLIAHASETAKQFDTKLRSGILRVKEGSDGDGDGSAPPFLSSLHVLSMNESFLTTWASSELRLADAEVNRLLRRVLMPAEEGIDGDGDEVMREEDERTTREDLEVACQEIVDHVGSASQKCRSLESKERIATFLKLTELPLLQSMRAMLKEEVDVFDDNCPTNSHIRRASRALFCAQLLSEALEDRAVDNFYLTLEEPLGRGFYEEEIGRLRKLESSTATLLVSGIAECFKDAVKTGYMEQARFGEISAPDAAVVLTHDLSESLVNPLTALEGSFSAIKQGVPYRKTASTIWRPIARDLDLFFFDEVVLQTFAGGSRNAMAVASPANSYLVPASCARMARQLAFDAKTFVSTFTTVSANPSPFLPACSECGKVLHLASTTVLLSSVAPKQEDEEVLAALRAVAKCDDDKVLKTATEALHSRLGITHIGPREALELLAIGGLRFAIRLM